MDHQDMSEPISPIKFNRSRSQQVDIKVHGSHRSGKTELADAVEIVEYAKLTKGLRLDHRVLQEPVG